MKASVTRHSGFRRNDEKVVQPAGLIKNYQFNTPDTFQTKKIDIAQFLGPDNLIYLREVR